MVVATNHGRANVEQLCEWAQLIVNTRDAMRGIELNATKLWKAVNTADSFCPQIRADSSIRGLGLLRGRRWFPCFMWIASCRDVDELVQQDSLTFAFRTRV